MLGIGRLLPPSPEPALWTPDSLPLHSCPFRTGEHLIPSQGFLGIPFLLRHLSFIHLLTRTVKNKRNRCCWAHQTALFFSWISPSFKWEQDVLSAMDVLLLLISNSYDFPRSHFSKRHKFVVNNIYMRARPSFHKGKEPLRNGYWFLNSNSHFSRNKNNRNTELYSGKE